MNCLKKNPEKRYNIEDAFFDEWIQNEDIIESQIINLDHVFKNIRTYSYLSPFNQFVRQVISTIKP